MLKFDKLHDSVWIDGKFWQSFLSNVHNVFFHFFHVFTFLVFFFVFIRTFITSMHCNALVMILPRYGALEIVDAITIIIITFAVA